MTFKGKKVAVLGFGKEGRAMVDFLLTHGARVTVCDEKEATALGDAYAAAQGRNIDWRLGPSYLKGVEEFPVIVRSPGIPPLLTALRRARARGAEVTSLTKIFFQLCPAPIIGVTGTKGKGTTTTLIAEMLNLSKRRAHLLGNIGTPAISELSKIKKTDWVVYELSSFQLQDMTQSPHIAVILGLTVDHQDYHKNPREYFEAKASIVKYQRPADAAIFNIDYPETRSFERYTRARLLHTSCKVPVKNGAYVSGDIIFRAIDKRIEHILYRHEVGLKGDFNLENITAAVAAATLAGASLNAIRKTLKTFRGLPHRLEPVGEVRGVQYWNNSFGTTPETTAAAIRSFTEPVILLLGGSEKGQRYDEMGKAIMESTVKVVVGIGLTAPAMFAAVKKAAAAQKKKPPAYIEGGPTMTEMIRTARKFTKKGDVVLLAPGAASFDRFKSYIERGEKFRDAVQATAKK